MNDIINALFEGLASIAVLNHCRRLYADKRVAGMSIYSTVFFWTWGVWNIYYYPSLGQFYSFMCGIAIFAANSIYIGLLVYYTKKPGGRLMRKRKVRRSK
jgi:hypothetical protein